MCNKVRAKWRIKNSKRLIVTLLVMMLPLATSILTIVGAEIPATNQSRVIEKTCNQTEEYAKHNSCKGQFEVHTYDLGKQFSINWVKGSITAGPSDREGVEYVWHLRISPDGKNWTMIPKDFKAYGRVKTAFGPIPINRKTRYVQIFAGPGDQGYVDWSEIKIELREVEKISRAAKPDLTIEYLSWSPVTPTAGENVELMVTVVNQGQAKALSDNGIMLAITFLGFPFEELEELIDLSRSKWCSDSGPIAPGEMRSCSMAVTLEGIVEGKYGIIAVIDPYNLISESDKTNNSRFATMEVDS